MSAETFYLFLAIYIALVTVGLILFLLYIGKARDKSYKDFRERHHFDETFDTAREKLSKR